MRPILSVRDLASRLGSSPAELRAIADDIASHYKEFPLWDKKKRAIVRQLRVPSATLMEIQRRIKNNILAPMILGEGVHGGVRGRSPRSNAAQHLGRRCLVTLDVKAFFPSVRHYIVHRLFKHELRFGREVARLLTRLTTLDSELPQGAPTSTAIANLLLASPVDVPVSRKAKGLDLRYTRFVDDIALSGSDPRPLINMVGRSLSKRRLPMHRKKAKWYSKPKLKITPRTKPQEVTGLIVNSRNGPSVSRKRRDKVRAAIFALRNADEDALQLETKSILGRIAHVRQFNPGTAKRLQQYLDATLGTRRAAR